MENWQITVFTVLTTSLFTLAAALGAQFLAAKQADRHRKDDLQRAQDQADTRAIASFLRSLHFLQENWRQKSALAATENPSQGDLHRSVKQALDERIDYLNSLLMETEALHLSSQNKRVSDQIGKVYSLLSLHFTAAKNEYEVLKLDLETSSLSLKRNMIWIGFEQQLRPQLLAQRSKLVSIAKSELNPSEDSYKFAGLFT